MFNTLVARAVFLALSLASAGSALAFFHNYTINELYSNADGSIQFIELANGNVNGEMLSAGHTIIVDRGGASHSFTFASNLPSSATANTSVLIATQGFADLAIVTPDFILPAGFLFVDGGTMRLGSPAFDSVSYAALPTGGNLSVNRIGTTGVNSPRNFAGATGTIPAPATVALNFVPGWNLVGNSSGGTLDVAAAFSDATKVSTVWKWTGSSAKWAFYAPSLAGQALADYTTGKGYDVLTTVSGGEGFWVNATASFTAQLPAGTAIASSAFQTMSSGWNLIAIGDNKTPSEFNALAGASTPLTTLWAWDAAQTNWYFYAPSLDADGGLASYITGKGYLDFTAANKTLIWLSVSTESNWPVPRSAVGELRNPIAG